MADRVEQTGSWALSDVIDVLQANGILPSNANEGTALANMIGSLASSYAENLEGSTLSNGAKITLKVFKNGVFVPVTVVLDYGNGTNFQKALVKSIAGVATAELVALASGALLNPATAPFAIAIGVVAVGYFAGGFVANEIGTSYDRWVGPAVGGKVLKDKSWELESNYTVKETLLLEEYHQNLTPYENNNFTLKGDRDGVTLTHTLNSGNSTYGLNLSKSSADNDGYIEALVLYRPFADFKLKTTSGTNDITNLLKKTQSQISSLAKADEAVMYALANLKSYAISGDSASSVDFTDSYINDRASMLYWHNMAKTHVNGVDGVNVELSRYNTYYLDMATGIEYGSGKKFIFGTDGMNRIGGGSDADRLYGLAGNDVIMGGDGSDMLYGGTGNDILVGGFNIGSADNVGDTLEGGLNYDTYHTGNLDTINDTDGIGQIIFNGTALRGKKTEVAGSNGYTYEDDNYTYSLQNTNGVGTLTITEGTNDKGFSGNYILVENFDSSRDSGYLDIVLAKDELLEVTVYAPTVQEDAGVATGSIVLSQTVTQDTTVLLYTQDNTATAGSDFEANNAIEAIVKAGTDYATFEVTILDDDIAEPTEGFYVLVDSVKAGSTDVNFIVKDVQEFIIEDDDSDDNVVKVKIDDATINEADGEMTFTISLIGTLNEGETLKVNLETFDISATGGDDYAGLSGYVEFDSNTSTQTFDVPIRDDDEKNEGDETFYLAPTGFTYDGTKTVLLENAGTGTIIDDDTGATPYDDILILTNNDDVMDALAGNDYVQGGDGNDILIGNDGDDILWGGTGNDMLYGDSGRDILFGDSGNDYLEGGSGDDLLYGGDGADILLGGDGSDYLNGGSGFDYYITDSGDSVEDSDGNGAVLFNNTDLSGVKKKLKDSDVYEDDNYTYTQSGGLVVTSKTTGESINISGWSNDALGITLAESKNIEVSVGDAKAFEKEELMRATVSLDRALEEGEELVVDLGYWKNTYRYEAYGDPVYVPGSPATSSYNDYYKTWVTYPAHQAYTYQPQRQIKTGEVFIKHGSVTFEAGDQEKIYTYEWKDNDRVGVNAYPNPLTLTAKANEEDSIYSDDIEIIPIKSGTLTIKDDDIREENRYDPLVLDLNKDGFISTTSLDESNTYFDLTGDGLRERVGWISGEDALLTYDKNENGQIDGIDEVFGSVNESGFDELRRVVDSNHDNKIDKRDELFNSLQVWSDTNGDAKVQDGELRSLNEANITSIDLNALETNIDVNGNTLTEASKYTDASGNKELVADIQLNTDIQDTKVDINDIPNYTVDESTQELPQFAGSGLVYDSFILYNIDEEFKAVAKAYASDIQKVEDSFETYIEHWSGYTKYVNELGERYSVDNFTMQQSDKQAWITERFLAKDTLTNTIETYYETSLNNSKIPTKAVVNNEKANTSYETLLKKSQSTFTILAFYKDEFSDTHYDIDTDKFIIDDNEAFNQKIEVVNNISTCNLHVKQNEREVA